MGRGAGAAAMVVAFLALAVFGLREVGFRSGPKTRDVTVHTTGRGGSADFVALTGADTHAVDALSAAGLHGCKPPAGALNTLLSVRGPKAVFVTEVIPSGQRFRFRWDCRLRVLRMADQ